jgi:ankyrin repeat protein
MANTYIERRLATRVLRHRIWIAAVLAFGAASLLRIGVARRVTASAFGAMMADDASHGGVLLKYNAFLLRARNPDGENLLLASVVRDRPRFAILLLNHGADLKRVDKETVSRIWRRILDTGLQHDSEQRLRGAVLIPLMNPALLAQLLEKGADPNAVGHHGMTALHYAVCCGAVDAVGVLLKSGARIEFKNHDGHTALQLAGILNLQQIVHRLEQTFAPPGDVETDV